MLGNGRSTQAKIRNPGNRRQWAVRQRFSPRHMKSGMYTEGAGQQETDSRGAKDFRDVEMANEMRVKFTRLHREGLVLSGKIYLPHEPIAGISGP